MTKKKMINDALEVKARLEWVEATMEEAIKGLETLTVIISNFFVNHDCEHFHTELTATKEELYISKRCRQFRQT